MSGINNPDLLRGPYFISGPLHVNSTGGESLICLHHLSSCLRNRQLRQSLPQTALHHNKIKQNHSRGHRGWLAKPVQLHFLRHRRLHCGRIDRESQQRQCLLFIPELQRFLDKQLLVVATGAPQQLHLCQRQEQRHAPRGPPRRRAAKTGYQQTPQSRLHQ